MNENFVNLNNSLRPNDRSEKYSNHIKQIKDDGVCPFCAEHLKKYHKNPIFKETNSWLATNNMFPYEGAKFHILFIHKKHIDNIKEITPTGWSELQEIISEVIDELKIKGGTTFIRFGDTKFTGATITHLHAHLISSDPEQKDKPPILTRVG